MAYAVIQTGGKQYRVESGNEIDVEKLDAEVGTDINFSEVLLVSDGSDLQVGEPFVSGAKVSAEVVDQFKDDKVIAFKFRRRKGYHRTVGHRRQLTRLKIKTISTK
ncbi:MAG: 50S ribosomal protein L21 [Verrucomicrobia bacterium]|nr:50S ribosomal protein L21 [Verrucomicrobiota bacterium]